MYYTLQEKDFINFMTDPSNPKTSSPPSPPKPEEFWQEVAGAENVQHLSKDNFEQFLSEHESALIMFYAPCK